MADPSPRERARFSAGSASGGSKSGSSWFSFCYLRADGRLSPPDRLAEYAERLPGSAFEHRPIWKAARENAQPHHCGEQKARGIRRIDAGRYAAVALAGDNASAEECFQFAHVAVGVDGPTASSARIGLSETKTGAVHVPHYPHWHRHVQGRFHAALRRRQRPGCTTNQPSPRANGPLLQEAS